MHISVVAGAVAMLALGTAASPVQGADDKAVGVAADVPPMVSGNGTDGQNHAQLFDHGCPWSSAKCSGWCIGSGEGESGKCGGFLWLSCRCHWSSPGKPKYPKYPKYPKQPGYPKDPNDPYEPLPERPYDPKEPHNPYDPYDPYNPQPPKGPPNPQPPQKPPHPVNPPPKKPGLPKWPFQPNSPNQDDEQKAGAGQEQAKTQVM